MKVKKTKLSHQEALKINEDEIVINGSNAPKGLVDMREADLNSIQPQKGSSSSLADQLKAKEHEIAFIKSSKFWKLREKYLNLKRIKKRAYE
jgi:hypothetical protein